MEYIEKSLAKNLNSPTPVPMDPLPLVAFFEQCQTADKATGDLDKLKVKKNQR
jgi:hypothetical protein